MQKHCVVACFLLVPVAALARPARGQTQLDDTGALYRNCESDTAARLRFIEHSLEENETYADYYFGGWLGFYVIGVGFSSFQAAHEDRGSQAVQIASAVKAVGGITRILVWPPNAKNGADASLQLPVATEEQCQRRLEVAEADLRENARQANQRWDWKPHVINAAIHVTGALIVGELYNGARPEAWQQAALGEVFGEAIIWSFPWHAHGTLEEYERRFPASGLPPEPRLSWGLAPSAGGAALYVKF